MSGEVYDNIKPITNYKMTEPHVCSAKLSWTNGEYGCMDKDGNFLEDLAALWIFGAADKGVNRWREMMTYPSTKGIEYNKFSFPFPYDENLKKWIWPTEHNIANYKWNEKFFYALDQFFALIWKADKKASAQYDTFDNCGGKDGSKRGKPNLQLFNAFFVNQFGIKGWWHMDKKSKFMRKALYAKLMSVIEKWRKKGLHIDYGFCNEPVKAHVNAAKEWWEYHRTRIWVPKKKIGPHERTVEYYMIHGFEHDGPGHKPFKQWRKKHPRREEMYYHVLRTMHNIYASGYIEMKIAEGKVPNHPRTIISNDGDSDGGRDPITGLRKRHDYLKTQAIYREFVTLINTKRSFKAVLTREWVIEFLSWDAEADPDIPEGASESLRRALTGGQAYHWNPEAGFADLWEEKSGRKMRNRGKFTKKVEEIWKMIREEKPEPKPDPKPDPEPDPKPKPGPIVDPWKFLLPSNGINFKRFWKFSDWKQKASLIGGAVGVVLLGGMIIF